MGRGCSFCHNGSETVVSSCEGCYKLHSYNWLEGMPEVIPSDIYEVRFKNTRKSYYRNVNNLSLKRGISSLWKPLRDTISALSR